MSLSASNNNITITDGNGAIVLNTDQPMPHVLQSGTVTTSVKFPNPSYYSNHNHGVSVGPVNYEVCTYGNWCSDVFSCEPEQVCGMRETCTYDWATFQNVCTWGWTCWTETVCKTRTVCSWGNKCENKIGNVIETSCTVDYTMAALEWEQVQDLLTISNAAGNDADFLQVRVECTRTAAGEDNKYGTFQAIVPSGQILCQGSTLLEASFNPGGSSWLRRIMSVYVEGNKVKVRFKNSNKSQGAQRTNGIIGRSYPADYTGVIPYIPPDTDANPLKLISSSFNFTFHITLGKFTS